MKPRVLFITIASVAVVATIIAYQAISSSKANSLNSSPSTPPSVQYNPTNNPPSSSAGEQVNQQGQRRPPQYLHICDTADGIEYVSQGNPKCLGNDTYQNDYDPSVAGTVFSSPCKTTSGTLRYVYISNDETCPAGTKLLFYNSLGGSTSGPAATSPTTTTN